MKYGAILNPTDYRDIPVSAFQPVTAIPQKHITDISMLPVMNQLNLGSCVGHAIGLYMQYLDHKETGKITKISPRHIYSMAKEYDNLKGEGTYPRVAIHQVLERGATTESKVICDDTLSHDKYVIKADNGEFKIKGYAFVNSSLNELKQAIVNNGLVLASLEVGNFNNAHVKAGKSGLHYVTIYGYDGDRFYFRNSWGEKWGDKGNGYFDWKDFEGRVHDIMVITDVPNTLKPKRKWKYFSDKEVIGLRDELVEKLDKAREIAGVPFVIISGFRSKERNKQVGGVENSSHTRGFAVDVKAENSAKRFKMVKACLEVGFTRIGINRTTIHIDCDPDLTQDVMWDYYPQVKTSQSSLGGIIKEAFKGDNMTIPKALQSSVDPNKLSLTVKGILIALIPAIIIVAKYLGLEVSETSLINVAEDLGVLISAVVTAIGLIRKISVALK